MGITSGVIGEKSNEKIVEIISATKSSKCAILVGAPSVAINRAKKEIISNSAFLIENGEVKKIIRKKTYDFRKNSPNNFIAIAR